MKYLSRSTICLELLIPCANKVTCVFSLWSLMAYSVALWNKSLQHNKIMQQPVARNVYGGGGGLDLQTTTVVVVFNPIRRSKIRVCGCCSVVNIMPTILRWARRSNTRQTLCKCFALFRWALTTPCRPSLFGGAFDGCMQYALLLPTRHYRRETSILQINLSYARQEGPTPGRSMPS